MRCSIALLFLAPVMGMAGVIGNCSTFGNPPPFCNYGATETITGNVVTIDFFATAERGGSFTLNETLVTDSSVDVGFIGVVTLTLRALAYGSATASGQFPTTTFGCAATSSQILGPDTKPVVADCYHGGVVFLPISRQIPIHMEILLGMGSGDVFLQAGFSELNTQTGQIRPLAVQFQVPEPSSIMLWAVGLVGLVLRRRGRSSLRDCSARFRRICNTRTACLAGTTRESRQ